MLTMLVQKKYFNQFGEQPELNMKEMKNKKSSSYMSGGQLMNPNKGINKVKAMKKGGITRGCGAARAQKFGKNG